MKFITETKGNLIVWGKGKAVCKFVNGECEVNDQKAIDFLLENAYETIEVLEIDGGKVEELDINELRQEAKEKGIKSWHNMKPENLIEKLRGDTN